MRFSATRGGKSQRLEGSPRQRGDLEYRISLNVDESSKFLRELSCRLSDVMARLQQVRKHTVAVNCELEKLSMVFNHTNECLNLRCLPCGTSKFLACAPKLCRALLLIHFLSVGMMAPIRSVARIKPKYVLKLKPQHPAQKNGNYSNSSCTWHLIPAFFVKRV